MMTLLPGTKLNHYEIVSVIGRGGMGEVWRARDSRLGREVAIKTLPEAFAADRFRLARFEQEARLLASLNHPNIAAIYGLEEFDGLQFLVLELVDGETLADRLKRGAVPIDEAVRLGIQVVEGLEAAHERGVIHRDIKPANIVINTRGQVKILDFGLAITEQQMEGQSALPTAAPGDLRLTNPGAVIGTVAYMSPEQARGEDVDARSDLFSFGVVLYEIVTGALAFPGSTSAIVFESILNRDPGGLERVPAALSAVIRKALEKDRTYRFQTASEMRTDLKRIQRDSSGSGTAVLSRARRPAAKRAKGIQSMAVLPLVSQSDDPDSAYLSEGIAESLLNNFAQLPKLRVAQRHKSFRYIGEVDLQAAARDLDVQAILWGRVLVRGKTLVVKMELIDIERDEQVWGQQYTKTLDDIFVLQDEIAKEVIAALQLKLSGRRVKKTAGRHTEDTDAYHLYLKGRFYWDKRTPDNTQKALDCFKQAVDKDPEYAPAYAGMADCYVMLGFTPYGTMRPSEAFPRAKAAARKALALDASQGEAHATLGVSAGFYEWDWAEAEREFRRSIELAPESMGSRLWFPVFLAVNGRAEEAIREARRAVEIDPLSVNAVTILGQVLVFCRRFDEAAVALNEALELDPNYPTALFFLATVHMAHQRFTAAVELSEKFASIFPHPCWQAQKAFMWGVAGRNEDAARVLGELEEMGRHTYVSPFCQCWVYAGLGDTDALLRFAEASVEERSGLVLLFNCVWFDRYQSDPRFRQLIRRVGLPQ